MNLQKTYPSLLAADLAAAEVWYTKLLGRGPDHRPMPTLLHWELSDEGGLMLSSSEEIAAWGAVFSTSTISPPSAAGSTGWGSHSATTMRATIRRWRRSAIRTATSSPSPHRPSDPSRPHDRADERDKCQ